MLQTPALQVWAPQQCATLLMRSPLRMRVPRLHFAPGRQVCCCRAWMQFPPVLRQLLEAAVARGHIVAIALHELLRFESPRKLADLLAPLQQ